MSQQFELMKQRRFLPFFLTQFLGAFNDNVYKNALVVLLTFQAARYTTLAPGVLVNLCAGLFILPFFLFSATAGQIADKYEKSRLIRFTKLLEIGVMLLGCVAFAAESLVLMLATLFLMGAQSTLFGPVKYAILPQHLQENELVGGNALVESGTFVAILIGTLAGGVMVSMPDGTLWVSAAIVTLALAGYLSSRGIPTAPAAAPELRINWNPVTETWRNLAFTRGNRSVFLAVLGISWFWFYGAVFLSQFPAYAKDVLGGDEHAVVLLLAVFSVGIGIGSLLCERLSTGHIEIGLVPFGSLGLSLFALDLWWASPAAVVPGTPAAPLSALLAQPANWRVVADLVAIGIFGGFYIVPLYALIQSRSEPGHRSRIIAGNNILNAAFMVVAAGMGAALLAAGLDVTALFLVTALLNAVVAIYIYTLVPEFLLRFLVWLLVHSVYRLQVRGVQHIPEQGAAVLVCNHVSFVDALVIMAASRRPIRFVMHHQIFRLPLLRFVFREGRAIPIASAKEDPAMMERAFDEIARALEAGELIAIFPEGHITEDGDISPFRPGIRRILERNPVPVVPLALRGLWGSFFSRKDGRPMSRPLRRGLFSRIELVAGEPLAAAAASPEALQGRVAELRADWR
ncbi:putative acyltransferase family protein [Azoarcus olearius]|uniref:MFS transporter n=1 Tax=Azoarcus sp. (strain BH72) TaxID=418699 RepID=UPI00080617B2|nr:MFS transporter [Azoarcus olearius]ANQ83240.1 putative acyltransferase family protein [Azoarcus olearius]